MTSVPPPENVKPWYLRNLTEALALNDDTGNVYLRGLGDDAFTTNYTGNTVIRIDDESVQHTSKNRRKISTSRQIFFNTYQYTKDPQIWDEQTTGNASSTFSEYAGGVFLNVGESAGDEIIRQTRNVIQYIPGRSNEVTFAIRLNPFEEGVRKRFGVFNEFNGTYFEKGVDDYYLVIRRNTPDGVEERRVSRSEWNVDQLDGTGPSGLDFQEDKIQMFSLEYEWYGAGVVEYKVIFDNNSYPLHRFNSANIEELPWSNTPFVPIRFELTNVAGTSGTHQILVGSSAVSSEGDEVPLGREQNITTPLTGVTTGDANVFVPVLSIRLKSDRLGGVIIPIEFQTATLDNTGVFFRVMRDVTLTGADWQSVDDDSFVEYDHDATDASGGSVIQTGFVSPTNQGVVFSFPENTIRQLGRNDMGTTAQTFTLLAATVTGNKDVFSSLSWVEIR